MKAALVSSLAYHPRLLILDEPFSGLDPLMREDFVSGILESAEETTVLISSHDLAEIESFASHIGYLANGKMQFAEEMTSLSARFRAIELTLSEAATVPESSRWPGHWLRPETANRSIRFIETRFDSERTTNEVQRIFGQVRQISVNAMPLREIFVALARNHARTA